MPSCFEGLRSRLSCRAASDQDPGESSTGEPSLSNVPCSLPGGASCNSKLDCATCSKLRMQVKELEDQLKEAMKLLAQREGGPQNERGTDCVVCMSAPRRYAFTPCGHRCVCHLCAVGVCQTERRCPICRAKVVRILRIIDS
mmetsp:Transcript_2779/g.4728  ORF Transcript_2779/g.4728 Transcript_2779/m.4728 type:complete len:142 (-) Transcript_2779:98-523(-)